MRSTRSGWLAPTMVAVLALAACGGDDSSSDATTSATAPAATTGAEPPTTPVQPTPEPPATPAPPTTELPATEPPPTEPPATEPPATEPPATEPATEPVSTALVNVYWASTVLNPVPGNEERIGAGGRIVDADTVIRNSLEALVAGPDPVEASIGMSSLVPAGTRVLGVAVDGDTATVDLSEEFENTIGGTLAESMQIAQIVFTVTQFDGIDRVKFHIDGEARDELLTHGFEVGDGLTRDDFPNVRPQILVEQPYPGEEVAGELVIAGESNTFEATVQFTVTTAGGDGQIVMDGFATATAGNGTWGTFETVVDLGGHPDTYLPGPGSVIAFESSPEDGTQTNVVEVPIVLPTIWFESDQ